MATKKDFAAVNTGRVYSAIEQATTTRGQQGKASPQEAQERAEDMRTQGRKGCKLARLNLSLTPENNDFISVMAKATGRPKTVFVNDVITAYRNEHPEFMEKATGFLEYINSGVFSDVQHKEDKEE